jgi:thiosulfate dehydrogenase
MVRIIRRFFLFCIAVSLVLFMAISSVDAEKLETLSGMRFVQLALGGLLYDNWPAEMGVKIDRTQPSYPSEGKQKGTITWRCKECHGWDYKGKAGAYSKGSHYTGIIGIRSYANVDPLEIVKILKNDTHALSGVLDDNALDALALFVSLGQIDVDLYIDRKTRKTIGDPSNGGRIYLATCIKCHGADGKEINFKDEKKPEFVGTVANKNPWETLHKTRWGHPGTPMISLLFLELKEQLDVLAFCQSLPQK